MRATRWVVSVSVLALGVLSTPEPTLAQQITGTPGSPEATTTITGKQLPPPDPKFGGVIRRKPPSRPHGGRRVSCRRRAHRTCCSL